MADANDSSGKFSVSDLALQEKYAKKMDSINKQSATAAAVMAKELESLKQKLAYLDDEKDKLEDIDDITNSTIKSAKTEILQMKIKLKIEQDGLKLKQAHEAVQKLESDDLGTHAKLIKKINELKKLGFDIDADAVKSKEDLVSVAKKNEKILRKELSVSRKQSAELRAQTEEKRKQMTLGSAMKKDWENAKGALKGWLGTIGGALSVSSGFKELKDRLDTVYDSFWNLGQPMSQMDKHWGNLEKQTVNYTAALYHAQDVANHYGFEMNQVGEAMASVQARIPMFKKSVDGINPDFERVGKTTESLIAISRDMGESFEDALDMYEFGVRSMGKSSDDMLKTMGEMSARTKTFNSVLGESALFANQTGKAFADIMQDTRYWVQDMGMLNTMFNAHIALLISQGKHSKEALQIATQFQKSLQNPPDLVKWKAGSKILADVRQAIKGKSDKEAEEAIKKRYGSEVDARTIVKQVRSGKNTGFSLANMVQDLLGGTKLGTGATIGAWQSYTKNFDVGVLKDMGLGENTGDAARLSTLFDDVQKMGLGADVTMDKALSAIADQRGLAGEDRKKFLEENKKLIGQTPTDEQGQAKQSNFQSVVVNTLGQLDKWFHKPEVQIIGGGLLLGARTATGGYFGGQMMSGIKDIWKRSAPDSAMARRIARNEARYQRRMGIESYGGGVKGRVRYFAADAGKRVSSAGRTIRGVAGYDVGKGFSAVGRGTLRGARFARGALGSPVAGAVAGGILLDAGVHGLHDFFTAVREGKGVVGSFSAGVGGAMGVFGGLASQLGLIDDKTLENLKSMDYWNDNLRNAASLVVDIWEDVRAKVSKEAEARLNFQGDNANPEDVATETDLTRDEFLKENNAQSAYAMAEYKRLENQARRNVQTTKAFGKMTTADEIQNAVDAETQRLMSQEIKSGDFQKKQSEAMLKVDKEGVSYEKAMLAATAEEQVRGYANSDYFKKLDKNTQQNYLQRAFDNGAANLRRDVDGSGKVTYHMTITSDNPSSGGSN